MPRLQVLYLPDRQLGPEEFERRFGLVLDELDGPLSDDERADLDSFAASVGAAGAYATTRTLDCDQGEAGNEAMDEFVANLRELVDTRIQETVQATLAQPKPVVEVKHVGTWGGDKPDPREGIPGWTPEVAHG
jgi:hypothetical protein